MTDDVKIKVIVIDDEQPARDLIKNYLSSFSGLDVVAECANGFEGVKAIQEYQPDLIFLDVQMPKISGFEMLELLDHFPAVIFSTAFDEYALKAFDMSAVDYLLKPYSKERFDQAVEKAIRSVKEQKNQQNQLRQVAEKRASLHEFIDRIVVKTGSRIYVIPVQQIEYMEADDDYVMIYTADGRHLKQQRMKYYENHLDPRHFIRVHRSFIVKADQISRIEPYEKDSKVLVLKSGTKVKVSKTGLKNLKDMLGI